MRDVNIVRSSDGPFDGSGYLGYGLALNNDGGATMPYLYCTVHGRGHENRVITEQDDYRRAKAC
jgi:hypothetical protein